MEEQLNDKLCGKIILINYVEHKITSISIIDDMFNVYFMNDASIGCKIFDTDEFKRLLNGEIVTQEREDTMLKEPMKGIDLKVIKEESNTLHCVFNHIWRLDYDNLECKTIIGDDLSEFKNMIDVVLLDFSHKICKIKELNPFSMPEYNSHTFIYSMIDKLWGYDFQYIEKYKKIFILTESEHHITEYIRDMVKENPKTIRRWCGGGEFPFIEVYAFKLMSNETGIAYRLAR